MLLDAAPAAQSRAQMSSVGAGLALRTGTGTRALWAGLFWEHLKLFTCSGWCCEPQHGLRAFSLRLITRCWAVSEPRDCRRQGKKKNNNSTTTPTTAAKFKYLLQSGLPQLRACPHLFAPCRRISLRASAGCSWSSNHQLNPADKVGKSGYNYFLMSPKHHYHMKDTVTNGFALCWLMETSAVRATACWMMGVCMEGKTGSIPKILAPPRSMARGCSALSSLKQHYNVGQVHPDSSFFSLDIQLLPSLASRGPGWVSISPPREAQPKFGDISSSFMALCPSQHSDCPAFLC